MANRAIYWLMIFFLMSFTCNGQSKWALSSLVQSAYDGYHHSLELSIPHKGSIVHLGYTFPVDSIGRITLGAGLLSSDISLSGYLIEALNHPLLFRGTIGWHYYDTPYLDFKLVYGLFNNKLFNLSLTVGALSHLYRSNYNYVYYPSLTLAKNFNQRNVLQIQLDAYDRYYKLHPSSPYHKTQYKGVVFYRLGIKYIYKFL